ETICNTVGIASGAIVTWEVTPEVGSPFNYHAYYESVTCLQGIDDACPTESTLYEDLTHWPADGIMQLAFIEGQWKPHPKENPADLIPSYQTGNSSGLDYCFGDGRTGSIELKKNGGFLIFETDESGDPLYHALVVNSDNKVVDTISPSEINKYKP